MKAKTYFFRILYLFLTVSIFSCSSDDLDEQIKDQNVTEELDVFLIDKDDIEEPDDRK